MKSIVLFCLIGICFFMVMGCQSPMEVKEIGPKRPTNIVPDIETRSIQFREVNIELAKGTEVGQTKYWSGAGSYFKPIRWGGDNLSISGDILTKLIYKEFKKSNYPIIGNPDAYFTDPFDWKGELLISGSIKDLQEFTHYPDLYGKDRKRCKGKAYLKVKWQIYSRFDGKRVYETYTEGSSNFEKPVPDGDVELFLAAFTNATRNLLADQGFYNQIALSNGKPAPDGRITRTKEPVFAEKPVIIKRPAVAKKPVPIKMAAIAKELTVDLGKDIKMNFTLVSRGEFMMGSEALEKDRDPDEGPVHKVKISRPFYISTSEVTLAQFSLFVDETKYVTEIEKSGWAYIQDGKTRDKVKGATWRNPGFLQQDTHPVVCVSWNDAKAFCDWLSLKEGKEYRIPTEAQWEYACRANRTTRYSFNGGDRALFEYGNYADSSTDFSWRDKDNNDGFRFTGPTRSLKPNAFGLYDMHGNVWEWCSDWYDKKYYSNSPSVNPQGPVKGKFRVLRGGAWYSSSRYCRSANRSNDIPSEGSTTSGFRVVLNF
ncbi:MAG: formylglycine-generating enzyme family protein [Planctomycetota bacterium]|jgi:formylglycine-generating enzyme required for sulfatase activity